MVPYPRSVVRALMSRAALDLKFFGRPLLALFAGAALWGPVCRAAGEAPPEPRREFRGAWVASVYNLDWPSRAGLPVAQQKEELRALLDRAAALKLNAIVLQVRPQCDALYASKSEPWSAFLTGKMGRAPEPFYDPLQFAVSEAHARGLELHAWFNPFRALANASSAVADNHISRTHPEWVRRYGNQLWLDPGEPGARAFALEVMLDVVRRYDIDGVHIDDYFYPYPVKAGGGAVVPFPDDQSWARSGSRGTRDDWRRANIDGFVSELYRGIKAEKRFVKLGISPFGIWRPRVPASIEAQLDSFGQLFADSRRWLNEGWCDYFSPQLYWSISPAKQSFPVLLDWWNSQNKAARHVWPGIATDRVGAGRPAQEISNQIALTRQRPDSGQIHWSAKSLFRNAGGIADLLKADAYAQAALVPDSPWLGSGRPQKPRLSAANGSWTWAALAGPQPRWWLLQTRHGSIWTERLLPGNRQSFPEEPQADAVAVRAIDEAGGAGDAALLEAAPLESTING